MEQNKPEDIKKKIQELLLEFLRDSLSKGDDILSPNITQNKVNKLGKIILQITDEDSIITDEDEKLKFLVRYKNKTKALIRGTFKSYQKFLIPFKNKRWNCIIFIEFQILSKKSRHCRVKIYKLNRNLFNKGNNIDFMLNLNGFVKEIKQKPVYQLN